VTGAAAEFVAAGCPPPVESAGWLTVEVPVGSWRPAAELARDSPRVCCDYFDWLSAYDDDGGFAVLTHLWSVRLRRHVLLRTRVPADEPELASLTPVYPGADWHERETYEMFGIRFAGHPNLLPLLLPDGFSGHPLRKEFGLGAREVRPWPGAADPAAAPRHPAPGSENA
jgi:NADH-quinone oxidoreductase subunit C